MKKFLLVIFASIFTICALHAQGTPQQAEALVKKAIQFYKTNGKDKAFEEFSNTSGKFVNGDLYIFVYDLTGKCVAHGGNPKMIGKDLIDMKDADGKAFVQERISIAKSKGKGWQNYKWSNPKSKMIEDKTAYVEKVDNLIFGCGAYKK
jgi:signal transduction histidine kinase